MMIYEQMMRERSHPASKPERAGFRNLTPVDKLFARLFLTVGFVLGVAFTGFAVSLFEALTQ